MESYFEKETVLIFLKGIFDEVIGQKHAGDSRRSCCKISGMFLRYWRNSGSYFANVLLLSNFQQRTPYRCFLAW